jgi:multiple sugar transport system permease protein
MQKTEVRLYDRLLFRRKLKRSRISYAMMAPFLGFFLVFTILPVMIAIFLSFTHFDMLQTPIFAGLSNYERLFLGDNVFLTVLQNTLIYALVTGPVGYLMSFFFAWLINEFGRYLRAFLTLVFYAPVLAGNVFFVWAYVFSGDAAGFVNNILLTLGITVEPIQWFSDPAYMKPALIIVQLWASLGAGFLAFVAGFQSLDKSLAEAGAIDGVRNRFQELWFVTVPQMAPQMMFAAVMTISQSFGISFVISQMAGFPTTLYAGDSIVTYINDIGIRRYEMGYASALAVVLFIMMLVFNFGIKRWLRHFSTD